MFREVAKAFIHVLGNQQCLVTISLWDYELNNGELSYQSWNLGYEVPYSIYAPQFMHISRTPLQWHENSRSLIMLWPEGTEANEVLNELSFLLNCNALRRRENLFCYRIYFSFHEQFQPNAKMKKEIKMYYMSIVNPYLPHKNHYPGGSKMAAE